VRARAATTAAAIGCHRLGGGQGDQQQHSDLDGLK
jgi:hypothetical protein